MDFCVAPRSDGSEPLPELAEFDYATGTASLMRGGELLTTPKLRPATAALPSSKVFAQFDGPSGTVGFLSGVAKFDLG
jgi:hypothetical protein